MQLIVDGHFWEGDWVEGEIAIRIDGNDIEFHSKRAGYENIPMLLSFEVLEWAINTLRSAPTEGRDDDLDSGDQP